MARVGSQIEPGEQHHAPAEHPDHAREQELRVVEVEGPRRADDRQLEQRPATARASPDSARASARPSFRPCRNAAVPAKKTNAGAQKCVIHRVKKTPGVGPPAGTPE